MNVEGMESTGIAIPAAEPNVRNASVAVMPDFISMAGRITATAEPISVEQARTAVIGAAEEKSGFNCFFGERIFPPFKKKSSTDTENEAK
ncbi:MAG TPA: hypothetical protein DCE65_00995 [Clostridiales bacterium]|nr:hypothetical protein [Clostridiales bacterium]